MIEEDRKRKVMKADEQNAEAKKRKTSADDHETRSRSSDEDGRTTVEELEEDAMLDPDDEDMDSQKGAHEVGAPVAKGSMSVLDEVVDDNHLVEVEAEGVVEHGALDKQMVLERAGDVFQEPEGQ